MSSSVDSSRNFVLVGNLPALDLVNTRPLRHGEPEELLNTFADLVAWLGAAGMLDTGEMRGALRKWDGTAEGGRVLEQARELRESLRASLERMSAGGSPAAATIRSINAILASRPVHGELVAHAGHWHLRQVPLADRAIHLLAPVAESAAWLMAEGERTLLRKCEDPACVLYFYDTTKNKRRRWCSMDGCGARAKAAAYYRRQRKE